MIINGNVNGKRVSSKDLEEQIQKAVRDGAKELVVKADGQHGIGGRIWPKFGQRQGDHRRQLRPACGQHGHGRHRGPGQGKLLR